MGGVAGSSYFLKQGGNDKNKIETVAENCGLFITENGTKKKIHLIARRKKEWGTEYVYRIPLGLSFSDFKNKLDHLQDGLNNKKKVLDLSFEDIKGLKVSRNIVKDVNTLLYKKKRIQKEIELSYDGMLKIKVYNQPLTSNYTFEEAVSKRIDGWKVVVGKDRSGKRILFDFEKKYNIIVSGTPGYGKSNWINCTINTLIKNHPDDVTFTLIDLKDGLEFNRYRNLKQVTSFAMTPEESKVSLKQAVEKMNEINKYLREKGYSNVKDAGFKERHFIIIDEGADLADDKECQEYLADIARKGRASGLKLIFATQYPTAEVVKSQIKRQCLGRLSFVLDTATASTVALDQGGAELLPAIEGRALYKDLKLVQIQTPYITKENIEEIIKPHERKGSNESVGATTKEGRRDTLVIEETGLS